MAPKITHASLVDSTDKITPREIVLRKLQIHLDNQQSPILINTWRTLLNVTPSFAQEALMDIAVEDR